MAKRHADDSDWRFQRAVSRVAATVDQVLANYATFYVGRPVQRHTVLPPQPRPGIAWSIDGELVVEFVHRRDARDQVFVHDVAILRAVRKRLRSRHLVVLHPATTSLPYAASAVTRGSTREGSDHDIG